MEIPESILPYISSARYEELKDNTFLHQELKLLYSKRVLRYYEKIITTIELNRENTKNSYIMYIVGKVDKIDKNSPAKISPAKASLPDYDMDFPKFKREEIVRYIKQKYGEANVGQIATYGRMQGRDALTCVLKAHSWSTFEERKRITQFIPDAADIADELQEMMEETGEASIIRWTLENSNKELESYCKLNLETGEIEGELAKYFEQAIRLEGTKKTQSKHAAGVVIFPEPLADHFPLLHDKESDMWIVSMEMNDVESCGGVKMDCLGVAALDKCMGTIRTIATGKVGLV